MCIWVFLPFILIILFFSSGKWVWLSARGFLLRGLLLLRSMGSRAQAQQLWCLSLVALRRMGSSSLARDKTCVPCIGSWIFNHWTTREVLPFRFLNTGWNIRNFQIDIHSATDFTLPLCWELARWWRWSTALVSLKAVHVASGTCLSSVVLQFTLEQNSVFLHQLCWSSPNRCHQLSSLAAQPSDHHLLLEIFYWPPPWSLALAGSPFSWASALYGPLPPLPLHPGRWPRGLCFQYQFYTFCAACERACLPDILTGMPDDHLTLHLFRMSLFFFFPALI